MKLKRFLLFVWVLSGLTLVARGEQPAVIAERHPGIVALEKWCKDSQPGLAPDWRKAEAALVSAQKCKYELGSLMRGMEFFKVTLTGDLEALTGSEQFWRVSVPVQNSVNGYDARAIVGFLNTKNHRVLVVFALPKSEHARDEKSAK